jgi:hypothetical protein
MRNIVQYPITNDEILGVLEWAQQEAMKSAPFSVYGLSLYKIHQYLIDHPEAVDAITENANDI